MKRTLCIALALGFLALIPALAAADDTAPQVSITSPEEGYTVASETVAVEVSYAAAADAAVEQVDLVVDGLIVDTRVIEPPEASGAVSFTWVVRKYDLGEHRLAARAYDSTGASGGAEVLVFLRRVFPDLSGVVRILSPKPGDTVAGKTTIQVAAEQPAAVRYVIFLVDDVFKAMSNVRPYQYIWDTTRYLNGLHRLRVKAYLTGDREAITPEMEVRVDNPSGATVMRAAEPRPTAPVAPQPVERPARAGEPVLPPPMRTESLTAARSSLTVAEPAVAVPGTAPFVSSSGELIRPSAPVPRPPAADAEPVEIAALPRAVTPPAPREPAAEPVTIAAPPADVPLPAPREPAAEPVTIAALPADVTPPAPDAVALVIPSEAGLAAGSAGEPAAPAPREPAAEPVAIAALPPAEPGMPDPMPAAQPAPPKRAAEVEALGPAEQQDAPASGAREPASAPVEIARLPEWPQEPAALPSPAQTAASPGTTIAAMAEAEISAIERVPSAPSGIEVAMLPPRPVELRPAPKLTAEPAPEPVVYVVQQGDWLHAIGARYGVTAAEIARANSITDPRLLRPGRKLRIPCVTVYLDGRPLVSPTPTVIADGRAAVPLRAVIEEAGGEISWENTEKRATAVAWGRQIAVTIGEEVAEVDGEQVAMGAPAALRGNRTVVPLRFLGDVLDLVLQYEDGVIHIASGR